LLSMETRDALLKADRVSSIATVRKPSDR
jgi:hypothetical protein